MHAIPTDTSQMFGVECLSVVGVYHSLTTTNLARASEGMLKQGTQHASVDAWLARRTTVLTDRE